MLQKFFYKVLANIKFENSDHKTKFEDKNRYFRFILNINNWEIRFSIQEHANVHFVTSCYLLVHKKKLSNRQYI